MASYKGTFSCLARNTSNLEFQTWGSAISNGFTLCGWTKVTSIGEIDWATVPTPATASLVSGFEIWKMADALQSTAPVAVKIEYGSQSSNTAPQIWIQVGSNNSGNALTGVLSLRQNVYPASNSTISVPSFVCGNTNRILFGLFTSAATNSCAFGIERTHDATGADTSEGVLACALYANYIWYQQYWNCQTGPCVVGTTALAFMPPPGAGAAGGSTGATTTVYPIYFYKGIYTYPSLNFLVAFQSNVTNGSLLSFTYYGGTHTYLPIHTLSVNTSAAALGAPNVALLLRWE